MEKIKVLVKKPQEKPIVMKINNDLKSLQKIVGGLIEVVSLYDMGENITMLCNEEGLNLNLEPNINIEGQYIVGTIIVLGSNDEGDFVSLSEFEIQKLKPFLTEGNLKFMIYKEGERHLTLTPDDLFAPSNMYEEVIKPFAERKYKYTEEELLKSIGLTFSDFGIAYRDTYLNDGNIYVLIRNTNSTHKQAVKSAAKVALMKNFIEMVEDENDESYVVAVFQKPEDIEDNGHVELSIRHKLVLALANERIQELLKYTLPPRNEDNV